MTRFLTIIFYGVIYILVGGWIFRRSDLLLVLRVDAPPLFHAQAFWRF